MQSANPDYFFQSDAANANRARKAAKSKNKNGDPIFMKSKILAAIPDPADALGSVFIAESAGFVRHIKLESKKVLATYKGPRTPVSCLAIGGAGNKTLYAGSWDKDIWSWDVDSTEAGRRFSGHSDFVKTVVCGTLSGRPVLVSGGADRKIIVWDAETGRRLHTLQDPDGRMLAVQHIAVDPVLSMPDALVFASASSDPSIRRWRVTLAGFEQLSEACGATTQRTTVQEHETSVYKVTFEVGGDDDADLWTASGDGTAKCLGRARGFETTETLVHGDHVRAVAICECWAVTAGRDEDVKVWDRATGRLYATLDGHFDEVTDLVILRRGDDRSMGLGTAVSVCSVSIDGTIRTWPLDKTGLDETVRKLGEAAAKAAAATAGVGQTEGTVDNGTDSIPGLTAEEEAELAELMED